MLTRYLETQFMKLQSFVTLLTLVAFIVCSLQPIGFAQSAGYLEDEGDSLWEEEKFLDVTGSEFETEDTQYVGEEQISAAEEARKRAGLPTIDLAAALEKDKEMLPDNIMYGIGTGAMIGGWFALVEGGTARDNVRFLTMGVLVGVLLGVAIGNKSLFIQQTPMSYLDFEKTRPRLANYNETNSVGIKPQFFVTPELVKVDLQFNF